MVAAVFRRIAAAALAVLAAFVVVDDGPALAAGWRVVGTGDSILSLAYGLPAPGGAVSSVDRWLDVEHGRNAYTAGMAGRASTASIWPLVLSRSLPGGWIVIQDNALGVSDDGWRNLMRRVVDETPNDRCLLGVLPAFRPDINATCAADMARRATIMGAEFSRQPCRAFVYWNAYLADNPQRAPDGQHPDVTGRAWLRSSIASQVAQTRPSAPTALTAATPPTTGVGSGQVRLAWAVPSSTGGSAITDYLVQRSTNGVDWTSMSDGVSTNCTFTVSGLSNAASYRFRVTARNRIGWGTSSNVVTATPRDVTVPSAPRSLTAAVSPASGVGSGQVRLWWTAPASSGGSTIADYLIQRSTDGVRWTSLSDGSSTNTRYTVSGLSNGSLYRFRVAARNGAGWSPPSTVVAAAPRDPTVPSAPLALTAAASPTAGVGSGQVRLAWGAPTSTGAGPITDYLIQRSTDGVSWTSLSDGVSTKRTSMVSGLTNGASYRFRVAARNAVGWSPYSNVVAAVPRNAVIPDVITSPTTAATATTTTVAATTTSAPTTTQAPTTSAAPTTAAPTPTTSASETDTTTSTVTSTSMATTVPAD